MVIRPAAVQGHGFLRSRVPTESPQVRVRAGVPGLCTVRVIEADTESAAPFLATGYAPGPSLAEHVSECGPLAPDMVLGLAAGLAEAVTAIHATGVIHRDLKPGNVLLTRQGRRSSTSGSPRPLTQRPSPRPA